jgi:hypothetical protein
MWTATLRTVKMSVPSILVGRFKMIQVKIPVSYFMDIYKLILKFLTKRKKIKRRQHKIKRAKLEDPYYLMSGATVKTQ